MLSVAQLKQATDEVKDIERRKLILIVSDFIEEGNDVEEFVPLPFANNFHKLNQRLETNDICAAERL